jgi:hypothetical protein
MLIWDTIEDETERSANDQNIFVEALGKNDV